MSYQYQAAGNAYQHAQYYSQGYEVQHQPWSNVQQHGPGSYNQQTVPAAQYGGWHQQTTQQPAWYGMAEQTAWYGHSMYQGQAAGYAGAHAAQQPASYGYDPNQAAQSVPLQQQAQQSYAYNPAQAQQQNAWQPHQAPQPTWPAEHVQQHQHMNNPQQNYQQNYQQDYQQHYQHQDYAAAQQHYPYGYSQQYHPQPQSQQQVSGSQQAPQMAYQPHHADSSQPATPAVPSFSGPSEQAPMPPAAHEVAPKPPPVDVASILFPPQRTSRPHSIVVIIRGIPGSGKSWLAQRLRALEIENGGKAPRILSIDPYFMVDDESEDARSPGNAGEKYVHDASKEASYEHALVNKLAQALRDAQHRFVIVDAPLLYAAGVQSFCAVAKAAKYEVFVTQTSDQDPQTCYERNVHGRTAQEVLEAAQSLESSPSAVTQLDCSGIITNSADAACSTDPHSSSMHVDYSPHTVEAKRKSVDVPSAVDTGEKRLRVDHASRTIDDSAVLAMVDAGLLGGRGASGQASSGVAKQQQKRENRSRWSDDDDSDDDGLSPSQVRSAQNSKQQLRGAAGTSSSVDSRIHQLLGSKHDKVKKSVRWPDQLGDEEDGVFRIGKPQQLETVHIIPGLGPAEAQPMETGGGYVSFADAVRAEHQYEKQKLLSRSKGL